MRGSISDSHNGGPSMSCGIARRRRVGGKEARCVKALQVCVISRPDASTVIYAGPEL